MKEENKNGKGSEMTEEQIDFRALLFKLSLIHISEPTRPY